MVLPHSRRTIIGDIAKFVVPFGVYTDELCEWYAVNVNPKELCVSARWMADVARAFGDARPLIKLGACFVQYRGLNRLEQTRPSPDISRTIDTPLLNSLLDKDVAKLDATEESQGGTGSCLRSTSSKRWGTRLA